MTEQPDEERSQTTYYRNRRPRLSTAALTLRTVVLSSIAALLVGAVLAWQMALGHDPALGPKAAAVVKARPQVIKTTVLRQVPVPSTSGTGAIASAPVVSTAPAPAPAPVTSSAS